jgi:plastocyanin
MLAVWVTNIDSHLASKERSLMSRVLLRIGLIVGLVGGLSAGGHAQAPPEIPLSIEQHKFTPEELKVKAGQPFVLVITNKDATPEEFESKELRVEKVIPANKTLKLRMPALKAGTYKFFGEYHEATAQGRIVAE